MAIKDMIGPGIGFSPGSVKFIITRGLTASTAVPSLFQETVFLDAVVKKSSEFVAVVNKSPGFPSVVKRTVPFTVER